MLWTALTVVVGAVIVAGLYQYLGRGQARDSVAVFPFVNAGGDPDTEYLSDGIPESLVSSLSQLPALKVKSWSLTSRYRGREVDVQKVSNDLGVQAVVTGRVVQRSDDLEIQAKIIMDNAIAQSRDLIPRNIGVPRGEVIRHLPRCFAKHFEIPYYSVSCLLIPKECRMVKPGSLHFDLSRCIQHVLH